MNKKYWQGVVSFLALLVFLVQPAWGFGQARMENFSANSLRRSRMTTFQHQFHSWPARNVEIVKKITQKRSLSRWPIIGRQPNGWWNQNNSSWPKFPSFFHFHHFNFHQSTATGVLGKPVEGNKYAIVIGISDYPGMANDLQYADNDARSVASILKKQYNFSPDNVYTFINASATAPVIYNQVEELRNKITSDDELVFYFSGHGARGIAQDGDNEMIDEAIVVNNEDDSNIEYLWDGQLKQWFNNFPTSRLAFVFDSCLAGGMTDLAANGRVISMATRESGLFDSAAEGQQWGGGHGEFTYYFFIQGIESAKADFNSKDGVVSNEEAFDYTKSNCRSDRPTISDQFKNDLVW